MTGPERVAKAFELSEAARAISEAGIRHRHPDWSDAQVLARILAVSGGSLDRAYLGRWLTELGLEEAFRRAEDLARGDT